jgi:transposase
LEPLVSPLGWESCRSNMAIFVRTRLFFRSVLQVDHQRWGQTVADLRHLALSAAHPRSRERFLALHEIAEGSCATTIAERTGRLAQTVMDWLHSYNDHGPRRCPISAPVAALPLPGYRRCAWRRNPCRPANRSHTTRSRGRSETALDTPTSVGFVRERFGRRFCRETIHRALHRLKLSWKKAHKLLGRAEPEQRGAYPSGCRSRLWLGRARQALPRSVKLTWPEGQSLILWVVPV